MKSITFFILFLSAISFAQVKTDLKTPFEKGNGNQSTTYEECITYYKNLDSQFETVSIKEMGLTDSGEPLHIVTFSENKNFDYKQNM